MSGKQSPKLLGSHLKQAKEFLTILPALLSNVECGYATQTGTAYAQ